MADEILRYESQIKVSPTSVGKINEQFALVDIMLCYANENRNGSYISKDTIENCLYSLYGCPIVGERVIKDDGSEDFGTHGGKIIIDSSGIKFEQTTKALGFITKDAVENAEWVTVTEKDGHTQHEYLQLKGCVVWQERFEETKELLDKDYPQSMELCVKQSHYNDEYYLVIDDFVFTAACILGTGVEPCFESACIGRHYELDDIKKDLDIMKLAYNEYQNNITNKEKEECEMNFAKIVEKLSELTYENSVGETCAKYALIDVVDNSIGVVDREDNKVYSFDCVENEGEIVIDMDSKTECAMTYRTMPEENAFDYAKEIDVAQKIKESELTKSFSDEYNAKIDEITVAYEKLKSDYDTMFVQYEKYKAADEARVEKEKHEKIDAVVEKYAKKIGRLPKFLCYRAKIDYNKDVADIENELILMAGEAMMDNSNKQNFSYNPTVSGVDGVKTEKFSHSDRYGNLLDKYMND